MKKRAHVVLPESVITALDRLVGPRKRSRFIIEAVEKELPRLAVLQTLQETAGAWQAEDHPELDLGVEAWVNELREHDRPRDERGNRG